MDCSPFSGVVGQIIAWTVKLERPLSAGPWGTKP
jgi:hypothetical protein